MLSINLIHLPIDFQRKPKTRAKIKVNYEWKRLIDVEKAQFSKGHMNCDRANKR